MAQLLKVSPNCNTCKKCIYYKRQNDTCGCCDYIGVEGHSRMFDDKGNYRIAIGTCDKFKDAKKG